MVKLVEKFAIAIKTLGDPDNVRDYLTKDNLIDKETVRNLHKNCHSIKTALEHLGNVSDVPHVRPASTINHYGEYMLYRPQDDKLLYLLSVAEVFQPNHRNYTRRKTLGFIRSKGSTFPLVCALSGMKNVLEDHPRMLNTAEWLEEVKHWAKNLDYKFKTGMWAKKHNVDGGDGHASHVEPALMLWYACEMVNKTVEQYPSNRSAARQIWQLRGMDLKAELVLSKAPCSECLRFRDKIQHQTQIEFTFAKPIANLADSFPVKDANGFDIYPRLAQGSDRDIELNEAFDDFLELFIDEQKAEDRIAVEIPVSPSLFTPKAKVHQVQKHTPKSQSHHSNVRPLNNEKDFPDSTSKPPPPMFSQMVKSSKIVQKKTIRSFAYESPGGSKNTIILEDDESDYEPHTPSKSLSIVHRSRYTTPQKPTAQWNPPTPSSMPYGDPIPFSNQAIQRANELRKKRKSDARASTLR